MLPEPAAVHVPPPAPTHVQVHVRDAGKVSATVDPAAGEVPTFDAVIVYVVEPPAVTVVTPSVFVMAKSSDRPNGGAGGAGLASAAEPVHAMGLASPGAAAAGSA
jgi:hypothetical protein